MTSLRSPRDQPAPSLRPELDCPGVQGNRAFGGQFKGPDPQMLGHETPRWMHGQTLILPWPVHLLPICVEQLHVTPIGSTSPVSFLLPSHLTRRASAAYLKNHGTSQPCISAPPRSASPHSTYLLSDLLYSPPECC